MARKGTTVCTAQSCKTYDLMKPAGDDRDNAGVELVGGKPCRQLGEELEESHMAPPVIASILLHDCERLQNIIPGLAALPLVVQEQT